MRLGVACLVAVVACGGQPAAPRVAVTKAPPAASSGPDETFRETPPAIGAARPYFVPQLVEKRLPNGVRILSAQLDGNGLGLRIILDGSARFPSQPAGMLMWMSRSLIGATKTRDSTTLRRLLEDAPASWGIDANADTIAISVRTTGKARVDDCIDVLADVVQNNTLAAETFTFQLPPLAAAARTWSDNPSFLALMTLAKLQYGESHPYAAILEAGLERSPKYDARAARALFDAVARPDQTTIVAIGAVDARVLGKIESAFGAWRARPSRIVATPVPRATPASPLPKVVVIDRPGAAQSRIAVGALGPGHDEPDWLTWMLAQQVLGGSPTSRIPRTLIATGAIWSGRTNLYSHPSVSMLTFEGSVATPRTSEMLAEVYKQIAAFREGDLQTAELDVGKSSVLGHVPQLLETTEGALDAFGGIAEEALPLDWYTRMFATVRAISPADVTKTARERLAAERLTTVIVGDWKSIEPQLKSYAPIELRKP